MSANETQAPPAGTAPEPESPHPEVVSSESVNLSGTWQQWWATLSPELQGVLDLLSLVGIGLIIVSVISLVWRRSRGAGGKGSNNPFLWTLVLGAFLCSPHVTIPLLLGVVDAVWALLLSVVGVL